MNPNAMIAFALDRQAALLREAELGRSAVPLRPASTGRWLHAFLSAPRAAAPAPSVPCPTC